MHGVNIFPSFSLYFSTQSTEGVPEQWDTQGFSSLFAIFPTPQSFDSHISEHKHNLHTQQAEMVLILLLDNKSLD